MAKRQPRRWGCLWLAAMLAGFVPAGSAAEETSYSPHAGRDYATNVYWGDLHVHTGFSTDAYTNGVRATPEDAYRFFKGGEIEHAACPPRPKGGDSMRVT